MFSLGCAFFSFVEDKQYLRGSVVFVYFDNLFFIYKISKIEMTSLFKKKKDTRVYKGRHKGIYANRFQRAFKCIYYYYF